MNTPGPHTQSMIVAAFEDDRMVAAALARLRALDAQDQIELRATIVVIRQWDGRVVEQPNAEARRAAGTIDTDFLRLLISIIGRPLGILIGGTSGALVGSMFDGAEIEEADSVLGDISAAVGVGRVTLLAAVVDREPDVIDANLSELGGTIVRRARRSVEIEVSAARRAERAARSAARAQLFNARREHAKLRQRP